MSHKNETTQTPDKPTDAEMIAWLDLCCKCYTKDWPTLNAASGKTAHDALLSIRDRLASLTPTKDAEELAKSYAWKIFNQQIENNPGALYDHLLQMLGEPLPFIDTEETTENLVRELEDLIPITAWFGHRMATLVKVQKYITAAEQRGYERGRADGLLPDGFVGVPERMTDAMEAVGLFHMDQGNDLDDIYGGMVAARPDIPTTNSKKK